MRRFLRRTGQVFDWRTGVVVIVLLIIGLAGYTIIAAVQQAHSAMKAAHDATVSANQRASGATRRIDRLNSEIQQLQADIAAGRDERGQLAAAVAALSAQVRQLGGEPVIVVVTPSPDSEPTPSQAPSSHPSSSPSRTPHPTPSPTCTRLPIIGTCRPGQGRI